MRYALPQERNGKPISGTTTSSTEAAGAVTNAADGATLNISGGNVTDSLTLDKSVTLNGTNADKAQNFDQEV